MLSQGIGCLYSSLLGTGQVGHVGHTGVGHIVVGHIGQYGHIEHNWQMLEVLYGDTVVFFAVLPIISRSTSARPSATTIVFSTSLPTISTTTDSGPPKAMALDTIKISIATNIKYLNSFPSLGLNI